MSHKPHQRQGMSIIVALVCLVVVSLLLVAMTQILSAARGQSQLRLLSLQSEWLGENAQDYVEGIDASDEVLETSVWTIDTLDGHRLSVTTTTIEEEQQVEINAEIRKRERVVARSKRTAIPKDKSNDE